DRVARAPARAISAEMHSGFAALRNAMPLNCRKRVAPTALRDDVSRDVLRIGSIWRNARARNADAGPFLFGKFSIADAMYAPIALRFLSYSIALAGAEQAYAQNLLALPAMQEWTAEAATEGIAPLHEQDVA
ncbi:MAG: glutathione S-transferase, partial [Rudaea sp.]